MSSYTMPQTTRTLAQHRWYWNVGNVGDGQGHSNKLSAKLLFDLRSWMVGVRVMRESYHLFVFIAPLPTFMVRLHWAKSYGGRYR